MDVMVIDPNKDYGVEIIDNELDNFLSNVVNENAKAVILRSYALFNYLAYKDYVEEYDNILSDINRRVVDYNIALDELVELAKEHMIKLVSRTGIIINPDMDVSDIDLDLLNDIVYGISVLNNMDIALAHAIEGVLEDTIDDNITRLYTILLIVNPTINEHSFRTHVSDVTDIFFNRLKTNIRNHIVLNEDMLTEIDNVSENLVKLVDIILSIGYKNVPNVIQELIEDQNNTYELANNNSKLVSSYMILENNINDFDNGLVDFNAIAYSLLDCLIIELFRENDSSKAISDITDKINNMNVTNKTKELINEHINLMNSNNVIRAINNVISDIRKQMNIGDNNE